METEVKEFLRQQAHCFKHHNRLMWKKQGARLPLFLILLSLSVLFLSGCISPKAKVERATLLKTENAGQDQLLAEVNRFARVNSMRAKMDLKFEDNSFAELGIAEKYKTADGEVVVQRPSNILLKVQIPIIKTDVAQMTSNGEKFCVAILEDGAGGKYKKFVCGTNTADYSSLQKEIDKIENGDALKKNVSVFSNLRPQHFTEAVLVRPVDTTANIYVQSEIFQEEFDINAKQKSPLRWVLRGYYLLDEVSKQADGTTKISRRFWFDRVDSIRLARQQIFDAQGNVESDIVYGTEGALTDSPDYKNLPLRIVVTRPKEKYKMSLTYQDPAGVSIGKTYPEQAFMLKNIWNLPEVNLDEKLQEVRTRQTQAEVDKSPTPNNK
jgi:outer membrane murein-binding lipoprotein Lpp